MYQNVRQGTFVILGSTENLKSAWAMCSPDPPAPSKILVFSLKNLIFNFSWLLKILYFMCTGILSACTFVEGVGSSATWATGGGAGNWTQDLRSSSYWSEALGRPSSLLPLLFSGLVSLCALAVLELCRSGWPLPPRDPTASAPEVLVLKAFATTAWLKIR